MKLIELIKFILSYKRTTGFVLAGCIISMYFIYIRLIWDRPARLLFENITEIQLWVYFDLFIVFGGISLIYIYYWYREKYPKIKKLSNPWVIYFKNKIKFYAVYIATYISMLYEYSLQYFDFFIRKVIIEDWLGQKTFSLRILELYVKIFSYTTKYFTQHFFVLFIFVYLPKIIMLSILAIDVFIFKKIEYFYVAAPIYLIPIIWQYLLYIVKHVANEIYHIYCEEIEYSNPETGEIITAQKHFAMECYCVVPQRRNKYHAFNEKLYNKFLIGLYVNFTKPILNKLYALNYSAKDVDELLTKDLKIIRPHLDAMLILIMYARAKERCEKNYKINKLFIFGYAIIWGYVFIRSYFIFMG